MNLPDDVLFIIRDFSRPLTRPDWRTFRHMPSMLFHIGIVRTYNTTFNLALILFVQTQTSDYIYTVQNGTICCMITPDNKCYYIKN